jgi:crossover junction endodeoxyribonuclease RuvC
MRILGVDPGTWRTGVGIIETQGNRYQLVHTEVITVREKQEKISGRLLQIYRKLSEAIKTHRPEVVALENVFYGKDITAMVKVGEARACAMLAAAEAGLEVLEYAPTRVKQAVSGNGRATKEQVQHMIKTLLGLKTLPFPDSADALAIAICHIHFSNTIRLTGQSGVKKISFEERVKMALKKEKCTIIYQDDLLKKQPLR